MPGADPVCFLGSLSLPLHQPSSVNPDTEILLATKTLDGGSGRGEGTRQPVATKPVASLPAAGGAGNFCLGRRAQCDGLAGSGLRGVIDLFPSLPSPLPFFPFPCWVRCIPQLGLGWLQQGSSLCRIPELPSPSVGASPRQKGTVEGAD